jgi:hypothetical protein
LSTKYPSSIDGQTELPVSIDLVTPVNAAVVNNLRGAIIAIESELGSDPSRDYGTVKARIDALEAGGGGGGGSIGQVQETIAISTNGQTSITLGSSPSKGSAVEMFVNGNKENYGADYTVSGLTVTWISTDFSLQTTDVVEFWYITSGSGGGGGGGGSQTLAQTLILGNVTGGTNISMTNGDMVIAPDGYLDLNVLSSGLNPELIRFKKDGSDFLTFNPSASVNMTLADNAGNFSILYKSGQPTLNANGSSVFIKSQIGNGTGISGNININASDGVGADGGGDVLILAGNSVSNVCGDVLIEAGTGTSGDAGNIYLSFGVGGTTNGVFSIWGPPAVGEGQFPILYIDSNDSPSYTSSAVLGTLSTTLYFRYTNYQTSLIHSRPLTESDGATTIYTGMDGIHAGDVGLIGAYGTSGGGKTIVEGGGSDIGPGGNVIIQSGSTLNGNGGDVNIITTSGTGIYIDDGYGGNINITSGNGNSLGNGGDIIINIGTGGLSGNDGSLKIYDGYNVLKVHVTSDGTFIKRTIISPTSLTASINNWAPTDFNFADVIRIDSNAAWDITGFDATAVNTRKTLIYIGATSVTIKNQSVSSSAANRFLIAGGDLVLNPNASADIEYDSITGAWRVV